MLIERQAAPRVLEMLRYFPVVALTGARQVGKTTLLRSVLPDWEYFNLESPDTRTLIESDPVGFLESHPGQIILDEIQRVPNLLSHLQVVVDEDRRPGRLLISGSQNLLLSESIAQSLAGRAAYVALPGVSQTELRGAGLQGEDVNESLFAGSYPGRISDAIPPHIFFDQYIATYLERDLRTLRNVADLTQFRRFMALLAGRIGSTLDYASIANDIGTAPNTLRRWLSVLEASYLVYELPPYHNNFGKRYTKSPKLYFTDTGLACRLLGLTSAAQLEGHFARGGLFENYVIMEVAKQIQNLGLDTKLYFYRDSNQVEVDLLMERAGMITPVEIKSSATFTNSFLKGLAKWATLTNQPKNSGQLVYSGQARSVGQIELVNVLHLDSVLSL
jgi:predicted AAA+ superfamily ATPase